MTLKRVLREVVKVVLEETEKNPEFAKQLEYALGIGRVRLASVRKNPAQGTRRGNRRPPAVFDPVALADGQPPILGPVFVGIGPVLLQRPS